MSDELYKETGEDTLVCKDCGANCEGDYCDECWREFHGTQRKGFDSLISDTLQCFA